MTLVITHPHLEKEWDDENDFKDFSFGSGYKAQWKCQQGHHWIAPIKKRTIKEKPHGCPYCSGRRVLAGHNDLATTHPELVSEWSDKNPLKPGEVSLGSHKIVEWKCVKGHTWNASIANRAKSSNPTFCPYCSNRKILIGYNDLPATHPELAAEWNDPRSVKTVSAGSGYKAQWKCLKGHTWKTTVHERSTRGTGCPYCSGRVAITGENDLSTTHPELISEWNDIRFPNTVPAGSSYKAHWKCNKGHTWKTAVHNRVIGKNCPQCGAVNFVSKKEQELCSYIESILPEDIVINSSERNIIAPYEMDIYIPEYKLAFEFNGTYWHSNRYLVARRGITAKELHTANKELANKKGVKLFFVWKDDWDENREEIYSALHSVFSLNNRSLQILEKLEDAEEPRE